MRPCTSVTFVRNKETQGMALSDLQEVSDITWQHCRVVEVTRWTVTVSYSTCWGGLEGTKVKLWPLPSFKLSVSELKCASWYWAGDCTLGLCFRPGIFAPSCFFWADCTAHTDPFCVAAFPLHHKYCLSFVPLFPRLLRIVPVHC